MCGIACLFPTNLDLNYKVKISSWVCQNFDLNISQNFKVFFVCFFLHWQKMALEAKQNYDR